MHQKNQQIRGTDVELWKKNEKSAHWVIFFIVIVCNPIVWLALIAVFSR
jgi:sugar phosphate permease